MRNFLDEHNKTFTNTANTHIVHSNENVLFGVYKSAENFLHINNVVR